jgi:hypothetical protein
MSEGEALDAAGERVCQSCGHSLSGSAAFCRNCGARYKEPLTVQMQIPTVPAASHARAARGRRGPSGAVVFLAAAIVLAAGGIAAALLLSDKGDSSPTTAGITQSGSAPAPEGGSAAEARESGSIEAGRYVQAGSFKFAADAEKEQRRLAAVGVNVDVVPSDSAQELYPGIQVLLGGPLDSGSEEALLVKRLHRNGVPSAFARPLTPASPHARLGEGTWTGKLEESSSSHPKLDRTLSVTLVTLDGGTQGRLIFLNINCVAELQAEPSAGPTLRFERSSGCFSGSWQVRPVGRKLMLTFLPSDSDVIVLGELHLP